MKTYALYGVIYTVAAVFIMLLSYFTGLQTERLNIGVHLQWLPGLVFFIVLFLGVREVRDERPDKRLGFGAALGGAMMISLVSGALLSVYYYIHYSQINLAQGEYMTQYMQAKMAAAGMPENVIDQVTANMAQGFSGGRQAFGAFLGTIISGLITGLMLAPGHTRRGSITRISVVNGVIGAVFGLLLGAANGFMTRSVGSSALIGLVVGILSCGVVTWALLRFTGYTPVAAPAEGPM